MYELKEDERWIKGLEGRYFVNTKSEIWSNVGKSLKKMAGGVIYDKKRNQSKYRVFLATYADGVTQTLYFHRCVAEAFIPNPEGKKTVNHINGNKQDNRLENLEWATQSEQTIHAYEKLKRRPSKIDTRMSVEPYRTNTIDAYIKYGTLLESEYTIGRYITEDDFIRNGVPYELSRLKMGKSYLDRWVNLLVLGCCLDNGKSLSVTSKLTGLDQSTISKARSGTRWVPEIEIYHKYKGKPDYIDKHISKISLRYNSK